MASIINNGEQIEATCEQERLAIRDTLELLGGKWSIRILRFLNLRSIQGSTFKKMQAEIGNISAKVLTQELRELELNHLVVRVSLQSRPITVQYTISEYGKTVLPLAENLAQWGLDHREKIR